MGNFDSDSIVEQYFDNLLQVKSVKIIPVKWHNHVGMRLELIGCYNPQLTFHKTDSFTPISTQTPSTTTCQACPGLPLVHNNGSCICDHDKYWDGTQCTSKQFCPCYQYNIRFDLTFDFIITFKNIL